MNQEMHKKYPALAPLFDEMTAARAKIMADLAPLEADADKLRAEADKAEAAWNAVRAKIVDIERTSMLRAINNQLAVLARSMKTTKSIQAEGGTLGVEAGK